MTKQSYNVRPGIEWVNGEPVPADRKVRLTKKEAQFDLAQGRIELPRGKNAADSTEADETAES